MISIANYLTLSLVVRPKNEDKGHCDQNIQEQEHSSLMKLIDSWYLIRTSSKKNGPNPII